MLFTLGRWWTRYNNGNNQIICRPFIMFVSAGNMDRQGRTAFINQQVDFAAFFAAIRRVLTCLGASQGCRARFAIYRLPAPADMTLARIEPRHDPHNPSKKPTALPFLKATVQDATAYAKQILGHCFPLTPGPQHIPYPIQYRTVTCTRTTTRTFLRCWLEQFSDLFPHLWRYFKIVHCFRFYVTIGQDDISRFRLVFANFILNEICLFFTPKLIYG